jgi:hypothetical protein
VVAVLARTSEFHALVYIVLGVTLAFALGIVGSVLLIALKDPTKLMLGQVSGKEFIEYQRLTQGDSLAGEFVETVAYRGSAAAVAREPLSVPVTLEASPALEPVSGVSDEPHDEQDAGEAT